MKTATFLPYLERLTRMTHAGAILDVGTGTGFFLQAAERYGFQPYGIKLSDYAAAIAATKFAADRIHRGTLEDAPFPEHFFSAVTMFDVLEHLRDPVGSLVIARRLLRSGGVLVIVTPNTASLTRRLMSTAWLHYKLEHLSYWNPRTMRHVAEMTGYSVHSLTSAKKALTLGYARTHLLAYPVPILTVLAGRLQVPRRIARRTLTMSIGEIAAYLRKR
jgi:2-polyprenyl-3-methyl-5-hydroxy-6-metoxy-1,4-benzoquinol methylase